MTKQKPELVASNPGRPDPGTPEFEEWLRAKVKKSMGHYFRDDAPQLDPELQHGILHGDFEGLAQTSAERQKEDEAIEAEQRAHARQHLKPM